MKDKITIYYTRTTNACHIISGSFNTCCEGQVEVYWALIGLGMWRHKSAWSGSSHPHTDTGMYPSRKWPKYLTVSFFSFYSTVSKINAKYKSRMNFYIQYTIKKIEANYGKPLENLVRNSQRSCRVFSIVQSTVFT